MSSVADALESERIAGACQSVFPDPGHQSLLTSIRRLYPDREFFIVKSLHGWYRIGGVVNADGEKITDDLVHWAYEKGEHDFAGLLEYCIKADLLATRLNGKTHFLVTPYGRSATDYFQIEIEETQEIMTRKLCSDQLPLDIEDFIDPVSPSGETNLPLGPPHYRLKRIVDIGSLFGSMQAHCLDKPSILRMLNDWNSSSASRNHYFCRYWVLELHDYTSRFNERRFRVTPLSGCGHDVPRVEFDSADRGPHLANLLRRFDRKLGYPLAWYFELLKREGPVADLVRAAVDDHEQGYAYLPEADLSVVKGWLAHPYTI